jgi:hypothetical protein
MTEAKVIGHIKPAQIEQIADRSAFDMFRLDHESMPPIHQFPIENHSPTLIASVKTAEMFEALEAHYDLPLGVRDFLMKESIKVEGNSTQTSVNQKIVYNPQSNSIELVADNSELKLQKISMENFEFRGGEVIPIKPMPVTEPLINFRELSSSLISIINPFKNAISGIFSFLGGEPEIKHPNFYSKIDPVDILCGMSAEAFQATDSKSYKAIYGRAIDPERLDALLLSIRELGLSLYDQGRMSKNELTATRTMTDSINKILSGTSSVTQIHEQRILDAAEVLVAAQR